MISKEELITRVAEGRRANKTTAQIGKELGIGPSEVSRLMPEELKIHTGRRAATQPKPGWPSLRDRIKVALAEDSYANVDDLIRAIAKPGEDVGFKPVTGLLHSMRRLGEATFTTGTDGARPHHGMAGREIPSNIRAGRSLVMRPVEQTTEPEPAMETVAPLAESVAQVAAQINESGESVVDVVAKINEDWHDFPTIKALVVRDDALRDLAKLADKTGDEDIQLLALEKLERPPLEAEAIKLWRRLHDGDSA